MVVAFSSPGFWENDNSFPACASFFFSFLKLRWGLTDCFHSLGQDQSTVAQSVELTVAKCSLMSMCELISWYVPHYAWGMVSPLWLHWVEDVCVFRCNLPPKLLAEWPGSFTCHCRHISINSPVLYQQAVPVTYYLHTHKWVKNM